MLWAEFNLKLMSGRQNFSIDGLPAAYRFIRFVVTETHGEFGTYINQVYLMAQGE